MQRAGNQADHQEHECVVEHGPLLSMECERESNNPLTQWTEPWPPPLADHDTRQANTAETGESVSLGRSRKREDRTVNGALHLTSNPGRNEPGSQAILMRAWILQRYGHIAPEQRKARGLSCLSSLKESRWIGRIIEQSYP